MKDGQLESLNLKINEQTVEPVAAPETPAPEAAAPVVPVET